MREIKPGLKFTSLPLVSVQVSVFFSGSLCPFGLAEATEIDARARARGYAVTLRQEREGFPDKPLTVTPRPFQSMSLQNHEKAFAGSLQDDQLIFGWRRKADASLAIYGGFATLYSEIEWLLEVLRNVAKTEEPKPSIINVRYVNFISDQPVQDLLALVDQKYVAEVMRGQDKFDELNLRWGASDGLDRAVHIQRAGILAGGAGQDGFILQTVSGKLCNGKEDILEVVLSCREDLRELFLSLLTEKSRVQWGFVEH